LKNEKVIVDIQSLLLPPYYWIAWLLRRGKVNLFDMKDISTVLQLAQSAVNRLVTSLRLTRDTSIGTSATAPREPRQLGRGWLV
jgi:hypothetical protein